MKKYVKFLLNFYLILNIMLVLLIPNNVKANSAQKNWYGVDAMGVVVTDEECPIEVTNEILTFDIFEFPQNYYYDPDDFSAYSGKVTADYTFYNPSDLSITATLAFPFGNFPDYGYFDYDNQENNNIATTKYDIKLNGEEIAKSMRYTWNFYQQFNINEELPKISDEYFENDLFKPNTTVTKYSYTVLDMSYNGVVKGSFNVAFDWDINNDKSIIYYPSQSGMHTLDNGNIRVSDWARNGDTIEIYVIGEPLTEDLPWKCYKDGSVKDQDQINGAVILKYTNTTTLEDLFTSGWDEQTGVLKVDWYNALFTYFNKIIKNNIVCTYDENTFSRNKVLYNLMRWYQYDITLGPKESAVNSVTAPLYPSINAWYEPTIYEYTYLLSPASTWRSFNDLEIIINTPYYITECSLDGYTKTETGYKMSFTSLPQEELIFTLCTDENPKKAKNPYYFLNLLIWIGLILASIVSIIIGGFVIGLIVLVIIIVVRKIHKRRKNKNIDRNNQTNKDSIDNIENDA